MTPLDLAAIEKAAKVDAWDLIRDDPELAAARRKLSLHEIRTIIKHARATGPVWPDFVAPVKYEDASVDWTDPRLPDFRAIWKIAKECGYSVGLHGSMKRDCDLIAVPWVADAQSPENLIAALCTGLNAREVGDRETKPLGRIACNLQIDGWVKLIDLSVIDQSATILALCERIREPAKVKPLEWRGWMAITVIGDYSVEENRHGGVTLALNGKSIGRYDGDTEARAAAQHHFASRIRSALITETNNG